MIAPSLENAYPFEPLEIDKTMISTNLANGQMLPSELGDLPASLATGLRGFAQQISAMDRLILGGHQLTSADEEAVSA
jgi:hypothetical protein